MANITIPFNNYCHVTGIGTDGKTVTYDNKTTNGMAPISAGSLVMYHVSKHIDSSDMSLLGKFMLTKVLSDDGVNLVVDTAITKVFDTSKLNKYSCQIISVAQFNNLTINYNYSGTTAWDNSRKIGGLCALACAGTLDIRDGQINVEGKGGGTAYAISLKEYSKSNAIDTILLGEGSGSILLIANKLINNENSRLGGMYSGAEFAGIGGFGGQSEWLRDHDSRAQALVTPSKPKSYPNDYASQMGTVTTRISDGANLFLIINTISAFKLHMLSTGGLGGEGGVGYNGGSAATSGEKAQPGSAGGCGFGGGGGGKGGGDDGWNGTPGYPGSYFFGGKGGNSSSGNGYCPSTSIGRDGFGGGSPGIVFIYCNKVTEFDETGVIAI